MQKLYSYYILSFDNILEVLLKANVENFSLLRVVHAGSGVHTASYPMGTEGF
jgi:hypothetical protein